ncbi:aspartyl protease family protein [Reichenbachiella agarivorans]|uniref:Aspartyl protease family protein n=1 Tax=Reichenbachiella agarivorans TaxID=2979464 RepID=A0ABY6CZL9_9BACT|nr:aspartyl protease family protein [Reichenbachiella agarivorans]UXP33690.1 aspartyl protease family protein [Reichenbachiella agarivorans]
MKAKYYILVMSLVGLLSYRHGMAQHVGFDLPDKLQRVRIDFELHNNLIVIPVVLNKTLKANFILDTGVQYPIITEKALADMLGLTYSRRIIIQGPGEKDSITALINTDIHLQLPGGVESGMNQSLLVLENDYLNLRETMGVDVYGIIGYDIFSRFIVEINYDEKYLVVHEHKRYKPKRRYKKLDMRVYNTKPYVSLMVENKRGDKNKLSLMIDTGASHSLLIDSPDDRSVLPTTNIMSVIGRGLGGDIEGHLGRVKNVKIGKYEFENPIVSFPQEGDYGSAVMRGSRNGTMGSEFLSRFNVVFDYFSGTLYIKKNKNYAREFEYDMSGMTLVAHGTDFNEFRVGSVRYNSPAYLAGVKRGDIIHSINGFNFEILNLSGASTLLRQKEGKKITLKITRGEEEFKTSFKLLRYI